MSIRKLLFLKFAILLCFCEAKSDDIVRIGVLTSLTGNWAGIGENMQRAISLAQEDIDKTEGPQGKKFKFDFQDTQEEVSGARVVSAYRELRSKGVKIFIGPTGVPGEKAIIPIAKNDDVIVITSNTGPQIQNYSDNFFNSAGSNEFTTRACARKAIADGVKRMAVFSSQQPWESDQAKFFTEEFKRQGGQIVGEVSPLPEERDLRGEAMTLLRQKPEAIFFAVFNQVAIASSTVRNLGFTGKFYAALLDLDHIKNANGALGGATVFQFRRPSPEFVKSLKQKYSIDPVYPIDFTYDAVIALHEAIKAAGSPEPKAVKAALHKINFVGSSGKKATLGASGLIDREIEIATVEKNTLQ